MTVQVVVVGRARGAVGEAVAEYEARAARYWKLEVVEVEAGAGRRGDPESVRRAEAERILARVPERATVVLLSREGRGWNSRRLANFLAEEALASTPAVTFIVGGAFGVGDEVAARARRTLSLSPFTLPHEMARLVLAEQLYRAGTIRRGEPYHKGDGG